MRWLPSTEEELEQALKEGLLREGHDLDLKRELAPGQSGNRSLAKDLAAMAIDGGALVIGVDEAAIPPVPAPMPLRGLKERIDQVAKSLVEEPLVVRIVEIASKATQEEGFLVVMVPPSPAMPHMVDGRYWGRGDTTNRVIHDAEIQRLHERRRTWERQAAELLEREVERDPSPSELRNECHVFILAQPVTANRQMLLDQMGDQWNKWIFDNIVYGQPGATLVPDIAPHFRAAERVTRRAAGWAAHAPSITSDRRVVGEPVREASLIDIEIREDGGVRVFSGCGSRTVRASQVWQFTLADSEVDEDHARVFLEHVVNGLVKRTVLAARVIAEACKYLGSWDFGLAITNMRGVVSSILIQELREFSIPYSEETYRETTRATHEALSQDEDGPVRALVARLNRTLNHDRAPIPRMP